MKILSVIAILLGKTLIASTALYVLGEDYLLFSKSKSFQTFEKIILAKNAAFDPHSCRLWVVSEETSQLFVFDKGSKLSSIAFDGKIISDFHDGKFFTLSDQGEAQIRNGLGEIQSKFKINESDSLIHLAFLSNGDSWGLFQRGNRTLGLKNELWISKINNKGEELKTVTLEPAEEFWGKVQLFVDELRDRMWIGYARASAHHAYAPKVDRFSLSGNPEGTFQWDERGFFFDGCVNPRGDFIFARDLPSSPYTVPDYSYVEKISGQGLSVGPAERVLELETSRLVDSMACHSDSLFFATHSIFGSEPKQLLRWQAATGHAPEVYLDLPGTAKRVFVCDRETN